MSRPEKLPANSSGRDCARGILEPLGVGMNVGSRFPRFGPSGEGYRAIPVSNKSSLTVRHLLSVKLPVEL